MVFVKQATRVKLLILYLSVGKKTAFVQTLVVCCFVRFANVLFRALAVPDSLSLSQKQRCVCLLFGLLLTFAGWRSLAFGALTVYTDKRLFKDKCYLAKAAKYFLSAQQANGLSDDRVRQIASRPLLAVVSATQFQTVYVSALKLSVHFEF